MVVYLDESGDLASIRGSRFFVIAALATGKPGELEHCIKRIRQRQIVKNAPVELKAFDATDRVRRALLGCIARQDIGIYAVVADKNCITEELGRGANDLYNDMTCVLLDCCLRDMTIDRLLVDKRDDKIVRERFNDYVREFCGNLTIEHHDSRNDKAIQATDFVAWAIRRKYASADSQFYDLIAGKIKYEIFWTR